MPSFVCGVSTPLQTLTNARAVLYNNVVAFISVFNF